YAVADYSKVVSESDEANNNDTLVLNCASPPSPDLVSRISPRFQTVFVGQDMPVSVATSNVGNAPAGNSAVTLQVGAVGGKLFFYIPPLAPNQSVTNATFNGTFTCYTPGNYTVASFADALGQVSESDESNNGGSAIIACLKRQVPNPTPPDPIPVPMTPSPEPGGQRMG
ncbi:hypothetical protein HY095_06340, partial [Candidatus Micrarchaeota archaeon]|nr:hypothetical protein [Candidatus Micrarchaeota archaeon]